MVYNASNLIFGSGNGVVTLENINPLLKENNAVSNVVYFNGVIPITSYPPYYFIHAATN